MIIVRLANLMNFPYSCQQKTAKSGIFFHFSSQTAHFATFLQATSHISIHNNSDNITSATKVNIQFIHCIILPHILTLRTHKTKL